MELIRGVPCDINTPRPPKKLTTESCNTATCCLPAAQNLKLDGSGNSHPFTVQESETHMDQVISTRARFDTGGTVWVFNGYGYFKNCTFTSSYATRHGGAIDFAYSATPGDCGGTVEDCVFDGNYADEAGGAIFVHYSCR